MDSYFQVFIESTLRALENCFFSSGLGWKLFFSSGLGSKLFFLVGIGLKTVFFSSGLGCEHLRVVVLERRSIIFVNEWMYERTNQRMINWLTTDWMTEWINDLLIDWMLWIEQLNWKNLIDDQIIIGNAISRNQINQKENFARTILVPLYWGGGGKCPY